MPINLLGDALLAAARMLSQADSKHQQVEDTNVS